MTDYLVQNPSSHHLVQHFAQTLRPNPSSQPFVPTLHPSHCAALYNHVQPLTRTLTQLSDVLYMANYY